MRQGTRRASTGSPILVSIDPPVQLKESGLVTMPKLCSVYRFIGMALTLWLRRSTAFLSSPRTRRPFSVRRYMTLEGPEKLIQMQKSKSGEAASVGDFIEHQRTVFDELSNVFASEEATPPEVVPVMHYLANQILDSFSSSDNIKLLDVGCGTGALFPFYLNAANDRNLTLQITGVDLSPKMANLAKANAHQLLNEFGNQHDIEIRADEFVSMILDNSTHAGAYDAVVTNACFGNFLDTDSLLKAMTASLKVGGLLCITHPLGADFVQRLHDEDPRTVPNLLPTRDDLKEKRLALSISNYQDSWKGNPVYFLSAVKTPHCRLDRIIRLRGTVDAGYGRGGKKLGFPTANLPESQFSNALETVSTGVYFGWAVIEGRNATPHKAAVNVGYSPTFQGKENPEKIVEAHLIVEEEMTDFYNETMRLALCGFLRPEQKFDSFPNLMAAISNDVVNAKDALSLEPFSLLKDDPFIADSGAWVGKSGGDSDASWEFQDWSEAISAIQTQ